MARPTNGRRLHAAAFDQFVSLRGTSSAALAKDLLMSQGHISDLRTGRRLATPEVSSKLAALLNIDAEAILWPTEAKAVAA
jgi:plasmid maintenance system antidote protein VapI